MHNIQLVGICAGCRHLGDDVQASAAANPLVAFRCGQERKSVRDRLTNRSSQYVDSLGSQQFTTNIAFANSIAFAWNDRIELSSYFQLCYLS